MSRWLDASLLLVLLPLTGGMVSAVWCRTRPVVARNLAQGMSLVVLCLAVFLTAIVLADPAAGAEVQSTWLWWGQVFTVAETGKPMVIGLDARLSFSLDGLSGPAVCSLAILTFAILCWPPSRQENWDDGWTWLLAESAAMGLFLARDVAVFLAALSSLTTWMAWQIGRQGGADRRVAALRWWSQSNVANLLIAAGLAGVIVAVTWNRSEIDPQRKGLLFDIPTLLMDGQNLAVYSESTARQWGATSELIFLCLAAGFLLLTPLFPVHRWWITLASGTTPAAAGWSFAVLAKIGLYGLLRFVIPLFPDLWSAWAPWITLLAAWGAIHLSLVAFAQTDLRRLVEYALAALMQFAILGLASGNLTGVSAAWLLATTLGLSAGATMLLLSSLEARYRTFDLDAYAGLPAVYPRLVGLLTVALLGLTGLPGLGTGTLALMLAVALLAGGQPWWILPASLALLTWGALWALQRLLGGAFREPVVNIQFWTPGDTRNPVPTDTMIVGEHSDLSLQEVATVALLIVAAMSVAVGPQLWLPALTFAFDAGGPGAQEMGGTP